ncbi:MAG: ribbon-helix-helix protein, CopG family [Betaproteobacteria bacterium]|nr:ribbon-helix-helix protein, CopG family [Betaproteobacteria bacterium]
MNSEFLTVRLSKEDARVVHRLRATMGLSKTEIVKRALRSLASGATAPAEGAGLFELGSGRFGRYGTVRRQSSDIKRIARSRAIVKRTRR